MSAVQNVISVNKVIKVSRNPFRGCLLYYLLFFSNQFSLAFRTRLPGYFKMFEQSEESFLKAGIEVNSSFD